MRWTASLAAYVKPMLWSCHACMVPWPTIFCDNPGTCNPMHTAISLACTRIQLLLTCQKRVNIAPSRGFVISVCPSVTPRPSVDPSYRFRSYYCQPDDSPTDEDMMYVRGFRPDDGLLRQLEVPVRRSLLLWPILLLWLQADMSSEKL